MPPAEPLCLLAHGDSWFDYPLDGNGLSFGDTDVIAHLESMGIYGDATTDEMSLPKQQRLIEILQDSDNWLNGTAPDAILFSGGGMTSLATSFASTSITRAPAPRVSMRRGSPEYWR